MTKDEQLSPTDLKEGPRLLAKTRVYACHHKAQNLDTCPHCVPILNLIASNNRLMNIRHIFLKMLTEAGDDFASYTSTLTDEEKQILLSLVNEANK